MDHSPSEHHHFGHGHDPDHRAPFGRISLSALVQLAAAVGLFAWIAPGTLAAEIAHPWVLLLWVFLLGVPLSLFEYLYHRYLLHSAVLPFLGSMHKAHAHHHGLTAVKAPVTPKEPEKQVPVESEYPVEHEHQEESMTFPLYALSIFIPLFLVLLALPLKLLFPGQPVITAVMVSTTLYYSAYELWHQVVHLPYERFWRPLMESKRVGRLVRLVYSFHLMHHWRPSCNLAVVGFWGVAIWDHAFRTHRRPVNMPLDGADVNYLDIAMKQPRWPISMIDKWQAGFYRASRKAERFLARLFKRRTA